MRIQFEEPARSPRWTGGVLSNDLAALPFLYPTRRREMILNNRYTRNVRYHWNIRAIKIFFIKISIWRSLCELALQLSIFFLNIFSPNLNALKHLEICNN